jgi:RNA polymerase sigma-70 factor (ECF subfamily)
MGQKLSKASQQSVEPRKPDLAELIQRVAGGEQSALSTLYDSTSRPLFALVVRILGERASAEEVLLDVYTQVWKNAPSFDETRGLPLAWLMTIARTRAIDRLRSGKQYQQRTEPLDLVRNEQSELANPEEATAMSEREKLVHSALESLSPEQREVIELAYYSGLSHSEIAARLGQPLGTVKTRARLGMIKLCSLLKPLREEGSRAS